MDSLGTLTPPAAQSRYPAADMPARAPLAMPVQQLGAPCPKALRHVPDAGHQPKGRSAAFLWRALVFGPALLTTLLLIWAVERELGDSGLTALEYAVLALTGGNFIWISLSVSTTTAGLISVMTARHARPAAEPAKPLSVALLMPIYNEVPWDVLGNASAMLRDLARQPNPERFTLFILSDTQDPAAAALEWQTYCDFRQSAPAAIRVHYRRRAINTDRKVGNLTDWITGWGGGHDAMLVLDADSLMDARAILRLADELAADPAAGLIQTCPRLIGAQTLFARIQQFSNMAYGTLLAHGLARVSQTEGNYWGHNAIIRTRAFADTAGLPHLGGTSARSRLILSHDFVEAALLRRAGWTVRFMPEIGGSYEETPASLVDYVLRDRRWCQGNLQHLRLLGARGFHAISRFHLFHGATSYLLSPSWFAVLVIWALLGKSAEQSVIRYFSEANPLQPDWPGMVDANGFLFLIFLYSMLLVPKLLGVAIIVTSPVAMRSFGGARLFLPAFLFEVLVSIAYAPIVMVQQTQSVLRSMIGIRVTWNPQRRDGANYPLRVLCKFHAVETLIGVLLGAGILGGMVSAWLIPVMASLLLAVPLSMASSFDLAGRMRGPLRLETPQTLREPRIVASARAERRRLEAASMAGTDLAASAPGIAAE